MNATAIQPPGKGAAVSIPRRDRAAPKAGFAQLREQGLALLQQISGQVWTDHNLHDPGITILEQLCFALTELSYRADFPVADHLAGPDGLINHDALSLHGPHDAFPCRATTAADYRRLLLDRVDGLVEANLQPMPDAPSGVCQLHITPSSEAEADGAHAALACYRAERGLGEDVDPVVVQPERVMCQLHADIEITGSRDAAEVLADVYHVAGRFIARNAQLLSRHERLARGDSLAQIYDGPLTPRGFAVDRQTHATQDAMLYLADVAAQVRGVQGVKEVHDIALQLPNGARSASALPWHSAGRALRLMVPGAPAQTGAALSDDAMTVKLRRRNHAIESSATELWRRVQNLQAVERAQRFRLADTMHAQERQGMPHGRWREAGPYHSVQHHFPAVYGLGRHGVPAHHGAAAQACARQLSGFLLLFEQVIANGQAQLGHLRELFSAATGQGPSYWWQPLGTDQLPGREGLFTLTPTQLEELVFKRFDVSAKRRSKLLDHLLGLHGEVLGQNAMRQFCAHLRPDELDQVMLTNKAAYLRDIILLSRHRAGAFDYSQAQWPDPQDPAEPPQPPVQHTSGLARRVCLLLGFAHVHARPLTAALHAAGVRGDEEAESMVLLDEAQASASDAANVPAVAADQTATAWGGAAAALSLSWLRQAASFDRYRLLDTSTGVTVLGLGPDEQGRWLRLDQFSDRAAAQQGAAELRAFALRHNDDCEGLHVVEHVLLRPRVDGSPGHAALGLPADFYDLQLTAVLPDWTARTHQRAFRHLAEETLRINTPAHLNIHTLWLGYAQMRRFEAAYGAWLAALRSYCQSCPGNATPALAAAQALDAAACCLLQCMPQPLAPVAPPLDLKEDDG